MFNEFTHIKGTVRIKLFDKDGKLKYEHCGPNLVVTAGKTYLAAWLTAASQAGAFMSYIGVGTGTNTAVIGDTDLQIPLATRVLGTLTSSANVWQNVATFGAGVDTGAITEAGLFSASSSGTLFARQVFSVINKGISDSLQITWQVTLG